MKHLFALILTLTVCLAAQAGCPGDYRLHVSYDPLHSDRGALISWRFLDDADAAYDVYRSTDGGDPVKLNSKPISQSTNFTDTKLKPSKTNVYELRFAGGTEALATFTLTPEMAQTFYQSIRLNMADLPEACDTIAYQVSDACVGDLDGDGLDEIVIKRQTVSIDNAKKGIAHGSGLLEAYRLDNGQFMWRVTLGPNIRQGTHYIPFIVYDLDMDGRAELCVRTSEGTIFGDGTEIGDTDGDGRTNYVITDPSQKTVGKILSGPEFLSVIDGRTGAELARTDYIPRGDESQWGLYWGDDYGNRIDRFLMAVGHFDGMDRPASIVMCRGYYKNWQMTALHYSQGKLTEHWHFDTADEGNSAYIGQGNHNLFVGDVDQDGCDEIVYGACCIDHDGHGLYSTGLGHGDALHLGKFIPNRPGLQVVACHESAKKYGMIGTEMRDAATGEIIGSIDGLGKDVGRCMVADVDPDIPGCEVWTSSPSGKLYSCLCEDTGKPAPVYKPGKNWTYNMAIWWSGSINRQLLDKGFVQSYTDGRQFTAVEYGATAAQGTKHNPCIYADLWGDWREEQIYRTPDNTELRIFTTNLPTEYRLRPLMDDHTYKMSVVHQNVGYNQPTHLGYIPAEAVKADKKR